MLNFNIVSVTSFIIVIEPVKMKLLVVLSAIILAAFAVSSDLEGKWASFKLSHKKQYKDQSEEAPKLKTFAENVEKIEAHNKLYEQGLSAYKMGINQFSDMSQEEFANTYLKSKATPAKQSTKGKIVKNKNSKALKNVKDDDVPESFDWRDENAVGPVKEQKLCSSWAFAAVSLVETWFYRQHNEFRQLSEQQLLDCMRAAYGCGPGYPSDAFDYIVSHGLSTEEEYPFIGEAGKCHDNITNNRDEFDFIGYLESRPDNEYEDIMKWDIFNYGPYRALINGNYLLNYEGGIIDDEGCTADVLNHDVVIIGYGADEKNNKFWIIRNSWGSNWGENGYARIARGHNNTCGISSVLTSLIFKR